MSLNKHWNFDGIDLVTTNLKGAIAANPKLSLIESQKVVFNHADIVDPKKKVLVLSGGGSGHEPLHGGFVGKNMLDIAVAGSTFASPSTKQIFSGIATTNKYLKDKGLATKKYLIVVKNYTGDILHFGLAAERARHLGLDVELVVVEDDVSVGKSNGHLVGQRGLAGTTLVHKILGGAAAAGTDLDQLVHLAKSVISNLVTVGASLDHCSIPGRASEEERLPHDMCEIGMGIHNETGVARIKIPHVTDLVSQLLKMLLAKDDPERSYVDFDSSDETVLMINNLGGTSNLELNAIAAIVLEQLAKSYKLAPKRVYIGSYVTSLNGNGFSITLLNVTKTGDVMHYLDLPTDAAGWNSFVALPSTQSTVEAVELHESSFQIKDTLTCDPSVVKAILEYSTARITKLEPKITQYDTLAGDGDCGETLLSGCSAVTKALKDPSSTLSKNLGNPVAVFVEVGTLLEDSMGGTSGGLYSIFLSALSAELGSVAAKQSSMTPLEVPVLAQSLSKALNALFKYTKARTGDKTLVDTLEPFIKELVATKDLEKARKVAIVSAKNTKKLDAKFGRASYVSKDEIKKFHGENAGGASDDLEADDGESGIPDPGAIGLAALIDGAVSALRK